MFYPISWSDIDKLDDIRSIDVSFWLVKAVRSACEEIVSINRKMQGRWDIGLSVDLSGLTQEEVPLLDAHVIPGILQPNERVPDR